MPIERQLVHLPNPLLPHQQGVCVYLVREQLLQLVDAVRLWRQLCAVRRAGGSGAGAGHQHLDGRGQHARIHLDAWHILLHLDGRDVQRRHGDRVKPYGWRCGGMARLGWQPAGLATTVLRADVIQRQPRGVAERHIWLVISALAEHHLQPRAQLLQRLA